MSCSVRVCQRTKSITYISSPNPSNLFHSYPSSLSCLASKIICSAQEKMKKLQLFLKREDSSTNSANFSVRYKECQKNHAARVGGYAVDGCREYMPTSGEEGTNSAFTCAACGCHRNFHRRQVVETEVASDSSSSSSSTNN